MEAFGSTNCAALAQSVERRSRKAKVSGSIPEGGSGENSKFSGERQANN